MGQIFFGIAEMENCLQCVEFGTIQFFMYRRPTLYPLEIAVDFLKSL